MTVKNFFLLLSCFAVLWGAAQKPNLPPKTSAIPKSSITKQDLQKLRLMEDTLKRLSNLFTEDSVAEIFPLFDAGDTLAYGTQQILGPNNWWGQLYYNIIQKTINGKNYYTTFGFEAGDLLVRRKIIDILTFDEKGMPKFGAPLFY